MKFADRANSFLIRSKLCDPDGTASLSNICMMVLIARLAIAPELDWVTMTAFFGVLLNHNSRKWFARDRVKKAVEDTEKLTKLESEVKSLIAAQNLKGLGR